MTPSTLHQVVAGVALAAALTACSSSDPAPEPAMAPVTDAATEPTSPTPEATQPADGPQAKILSGTAWETTNAKDVHGIDVPLTDDEVKSYVGYAYFSDDGTFAMFNLDDSPKLQGDWSISADGKKRTVVAKGPNGKVIFTRDVDIITLTAREFTYRVFPDESDRSVYYDVIHTPTSHPSPDEAPASGGPTPSGGTPTGGTQAPATPGAATP